MKKLSGAVALLFVLAAPIVQAHEMAMDDSGIGAQMSELNPFTHFNEGHALTGILIIVFWVSFVFALYVLISLLLKKKVSFKV